MQQARATSFKLHDFDVNQFCCATTMSLPSSHPSNDTRKDTWVAPRQDLAPQRSPASDAGMGPWAEQSQIPAGFGLVSSLPSKDSQIDPLVEQSRNSVPQRSTAGDPGMDPCRAAPAFCGIISAPSWDLYCERCDKGYVMKNPGIVKKDRKKKRKCKNCQFQLVSIEDFLRQKSNLVHALDQEVKSSDAWKAETHNITEE